MYTGQNREQGAGSLTWSWGNIRPRSDTLEFLDQIPGFQEAWDIPGLPHKAPWFEVLVVPWPTLREHETPLLKDTYPKSFSGQRKAFGTSDACPRTPLPFESCVSSSSHNIFSDKCFLWCPVILTLVNSPM